MQANFPEQKIEDKKDMKIKQEQKNKVGHTDCKNANARI